MLNATSKVANGVKNFPLRLAQIFLRCVTLGHIELVFAKVLLLLADAELQRLKPRPVEPSGAVSLGGGAQKKL